MIYEKVSGVEKDNLILIDEIYISMIKENSFIKNTRNVRKIKFGILKKFQTQNKEMENIYNKFLNTKIGVFSMCLKKRY